MPLIPAIARSVAPCFAVWLLAPYPALALVPEFPAPATVTASFQEPLTSYRLPIGPFSGDGIPVIELEGAMDQTSWRITAPGLSTLSLLAPLRDQLAEQGWAILYECETAECGGYDFRYGTNVMPEPDMHVDLTDFRFLSAEHIADGGKEHLSLLISRSTESGFVQLIRLGPEQPAPVVAADPAGLDLMSDAPALPTLPKSEIAPNDLAARLETGGAIALDDLVFASGSSALAEGEYASLKALSVYLRDNSERRIALVGHTDASGGLETNISLSRKRANSVRDRLIAQHGADGSRIEAEGVGYLAPRASNLTPEGRTANRRVEVMLTSTQ